MAHRSGRKWLFGTTSLAWLFCVAGTAHSQSEARLDEGLWKGGVGDAMSEAPSWDPLEIEWKQSGSEISGNLKRSIPGSQRIFRVNGDLRQGELRLEYTYRNRPGSLIAQLRDGVITGTWQEAEQSQPFVLVQEFPIPMELRSQVGGNWITADGRELILSDRGRVSLVDLHSGLVRRLVHRGDLKFVAGPTLGVPYPFESTVEITVGTAEEPARLTWTSKRDGAHPISATRQPDPEKEPFEYDSFDGTKIRGSLWLPPGDQPVSTVLWVHGSGRATRDQAALWRSFFISRGFGFLSVDKRGVGESEGKYELPDGGHDNIPHMARRAKDVAAAVAALRKHPRVEEVGLSGASQAGWVIPQAAVVSDPSWICILSGGATQLEYEAWFSRLADENGADGNSKSIEEVLNEIRPRTAPSKDLRPVFAQLTCPALWVYGLNDRSNPSAMCIELLEEVKAKSNNNFSVLAFPSGNHGLLESRTGGAWENNRLTQFVPGLFQGIDNWLQEQRIGQTKKD